MKLKSGLGVILLSVTPCFTVELPKDLHPVVVHEWGTFTSVASESGAPVPWAPLSGPADLPCFVATLGPSNFKERASGYVRMETPVLYFYSQSPVTLSVRVGFPDGWITEWYPNATQVTPAVPEPVTPSGYKNGEIRWDEVLLMPGHSPRLPTSLGASHYFAARQTDAAPLKVGTQWEKLIFYRGVGDFAIPLRPVFTQHGRITITNTGSETVPLAILFENRGGQMGYRTATGLKTATELDLPELTTDLAALRADLVNHLVGFGLYEKEASAMVETWRDSWFEEGMRVLYVVPREMVDRVLPLDVRPSPADTTRVFVGRIEMLSPGMRERIDSAAAANDVKALQNIGRFLGPFVTQIERTEPGRRRSAAIQAAFQNPPNASRCVK